MNIDKEKMLMRTRDHYIYEIVCVPRLFILDVDY